MELRTYLSILWRRKLVIVVTPLVTIAVIVVGISLLTPIYRATTVLRLDTAAGGSMDWVNYDLNYADRLMNTYARLAKNDAVLAELEQSLPSDQKLTIAVDIFANTELMELSVEHPDPALATQAAQRLAEILIVQSQRLSSESAEYELELLANWLDRIEAEAAQARTQEPASLAQFASLAEVGVAEAGSQQNERLLEFYERSQLRRVLQAHIFSVVTPAVIPDRPAKPNRMLLLLLGLVLGAAGGLGLAFLVENLDSRLYTTEQMQAASGLVILGEIPQRKGQVAFDLLSHARSGFSIAFTDLAVTLSQTTARTLLVTSAEPGEGKSTIAANLAIAMAQLGKMVALIDGDLRLPVIHQLFALPNRTGLSTMLRRGVILPEAFQSGLVPGLQVLTSGPLPENPAATFSTSHAAGLIDQLRHQFDVVIIDSPALLPVADPQQLAPMVDGIVLVARRGQVCQETMAAACHKLSNITPQLMGLVANCTATERDYRWYYRSQEQTK
jgi:capsular exopolysaccharide synthesis family protein